jgi:hypothetical protein
MIRIQATNLTKDHIGMEVRIWVQRSVITGQLRHVRFADLPLWGGTRIERQAVLILIPWWFDMVIPAWEHIEVGAPDETLAPTPSPTWRKIGTPS